MNVKLLRKVKRHILAEPKRLYMAWFVARQARPDDEIKGRRFPKCGTAACVAGWACMLSNVETEDDYMGIKGREILELADMEANRLFVPGLWPDKFRAGTRDDGKKKTAQIAAARIEHFIKTKGRE